MVPRTRWEINSTFAPLWVPSLRDKGHLSRFVARRFNSVSNKTSRLNACWAPLPLWSALAAVHPLDLVQSDGDCGGGPP